MKEERTNTVEFCLLFARENFSSKTLIDFVDLVKSFGLQVTESSYFNDKFGFTKDELEKYFKKAQKRCQKIKRPGILYFEGKLPLVYAVIEIYLNNSVKIKLEFLPSQEQKTIETIFIPLAETLKPSYALAYFLKNHILEYKNSKPYKVKADGKTQTKLMPHDYPIRKNIGALPSKNVLIHYLPIQIAEELRVPQRFLTERKDVISKDVPHTLIPLKYKFNYLFLTVKSTIRRKLYNIWYDFKNY